VRDFVDGFKGFPNGEGNSMLTPEAREKAKQARRAKPTRREKMKQFPETFAEQRRRFPRMALPIIEQAEKGSLHAAVKLTCLDCSNFVWQEIRDCAIRWCPLFPHRLYQNLKGRNPNDAPAGDAQ
jgi:hypothetical protein